MFQAEAGGREEPHYGTRNSSQKKKKKTAGGMWMRMGWHRGLAVGQGRAAGGGIGDRSE